MGFLTWILLFKFSHIWIYKSHPNLVRRARVSLCTSYSLISTKVSKFGLFISCILYQAAIWSMFFFKLSLLFHASIFLYVQSFHLCTKSLRGTQSWCSMCSRCSRTKNKAALGALITTCSTFHVFLSCLSTLGLFPASRVSFIWMLSLRLLHQIITFFLEFVRNHNAHLHNQMINWIWKSLRIFALSFSIIFGDITHLDFGTSDSKLTVMAHFPDVFTSWWISWRFVSTLSHWRFAEKGVFISPFKKLKSPTRFTPHSHELF